MKRHNGMRPHDIAVLLKVAIMPHDWLNKDLAESLYISTSEITESLNRSKIAGLIDSSKKHVFANNLIDFVAYGLPYVFPTEIGTLVRGIPTAHSAPVFNNKIISNETLVWADSKGSAKGQAVEPLYPNALLAIKKDSTFYDVLAILDAIRIGKVREKKIGIEMLRNILKSENEYAH